MLGGHCKHPTWYCDTPWLLEFAGRESTRFWVVYKGWTAGKSVLCRPSAHAHGVPRLHSCLWSLDGAILGYECHAEDAGLDGDYCAGFWLTTQSIGGSLVTWDYWLGSSEVLKYLPEVPSVIEDPRQGHTGFTSHVLRLTSWMEISVQAFGSQHGVQTAPWPLGFTGRT